MMKTSWDTTTAPHLWHEDDHKASTVKVKYDLKSWVHFFDEIVRGNKLHDVRDLKDRDFEVGDLLLLRRYDNISGNYSSRKGIDDHCVVEVTYITSRAVPCAFSSAVLDKGFGILSLKLIPDVPLASIEVENPE